ncbi:MAG: hypothetical protein OER21_06525 [Gemmatimonadota bacterium]|nr:hypothetical protein [Gemmatimonadota bacterium]
MSLVALGACAHSEPFQPDEAAPRGPSSTTIPRQLSFNPGDDRAPSVNAGTVAYSRYDPARTPAARCVALLPPDGGSLIGLHCPPKPTPADTFVSTWLEPAIAGDGQRVAFVWQRGARTSALGAWTHELAVAPRDSLRHPALRLLLGAPRADGRLFNTATKLGWTDDRTVRFIAAFDWIFKVKGGGTARLTDTVLVGLALFDLDVPTASLRQVPGGDSVYAWAADPAGPLYVIKDADSTTVHALAADGSLTAMAAFPAPVTDLAVIDRRLVAATGTGSLWWRDPVSGASGMLLARGPVHRVAPAGERRLIAEVERSVELFGAPANLWLLELPAR